MRAFYYLGEDNPLLRYPKLFEAALDEFAQRDFEDASLNNILKKANMSKGSLYHNFGDKFGLYLSMMDLIVKRKTAFFAEMIQQKQSGLDFFDMVKQLVKATMEFMHTDERLYLVLNHNLEANKEFKKKLIEVFPHNPSYGFEALVGAAIQEGRIDSRYSPEFISGVFKILLENVHKLLPPDNPTERIEAVVDQLIDLMQYGLSVKSS